MNNAIKRWTDDLARDPNSLAFLQLAEELRARHQLREAKAVALRGLERHPYLADAHDLLARVYADSDDLQRARDEWEMALRIEPRHLASLKGLGFLSFQQRDLARAEQYLRRARTIDVADPGLSAAYERVVQEWQPPEPAGVVSAAPSSGSGSSGAARPSAATKVRELFAPLLGDADQTALLVDRDGLVLAGAYLDEHGHDAADEIAAELSGVTDEAERALTHLRLGAWQGLMVEAQYATVALAPAGDGAVVLVAAARDVHVGFVRRLLERARKVASDWMHEGTA